MSDKKQNTEPTSSNSTTSPIPIDTSNKHDSNHSASSSTSSSAATSSSASANAMMPAASPNSHQRHSSIVDFLSAPPPLSSSGESTRRRLSSASNTSRDAAAAAAAAAAGTGTGQGSAVSEDSIDWRDVPLTELVQKEKLLSVDAEIAVEKAFEILEQHEFTSIPIKYQTDEESKEHDEKHKHTLDELKKGSVKVNGVSHTFDYADLNAYLLLVLGHIEPLDKSEHVREAVLMARAGKAVPVKFVAQLGLKDPFVTVSSTSNLLTAVEILGQGVHRIAVTSSSNPTELVGILSQRRVMRFIWENGRLFKNLEPLFQASLKDLNIGSNNVVSINGDELVIEAFKKMHSEGVSSVAVVDSKNALLGNISIVDSRFVTKSSQASLLQHSCKQFLTIILSKRGLQDGQDSFPIFHVTNDTTLGRTIAKLVATKAHRLWIVQKPTESNLSEAGVGGYLVGVVSLTDILNLLAKRAGKLENDPTFARRQRRRSSSSSVRSSVVDSLRRSSTEMRPPPQR